MINFHLTTNQTEHVFFSHQYPLPELVVIHQQQQSLEDVLSLETYIKQARTTTIFLSNMSESLTLA